MKLRAVVAITGYLACILGANWALERWGIVDYGLLVLPAGVWFAGLAFGFRDAVQELAGRSAVALVIVAGSLLSLLIEPTFAVASGTAFLLSEFADFAIYTPLRERNWPTAVAASNIVGAIVDSLLFLWLAFDTLDGWVDLTIGKALMILPAIPLVWWARRWTR